MRVTSTRLFVRIDPAAEKVGAIIIPEPYREKNLTGTVVNLGVKAAEETGIKPGDRIVFSKYGGTEVTVDGAPHIIIDIKDAHGIIEP